MENYEVYTQNYILDLVRTLMRDTGLELWTDKEISIAVNEVLRSWSRRVMMPAFYPLEKLSSTELEYELPYWMNKPIRPMVRQRLSGVHPASNMDNADAPNTRWVYLQNYTIEPGPNSNMILRLLDYVSARDVRIEYWWPNGRIGDHEYRFGDALVGLDPDTDWMSLAYPDPQSVGLEPFPHMTQHGLWLVENEYIAHHGAFEKRFYSEGEPATGLYELQVFLYNLDRGLFGTPIVDHIGMTEEEIIQPAIFVDDSELLTQLLDSVRSQMHAMWLTRGHSQERQHHSQMMLFYKDKADSFWRTYRPARSTRMVINYDQPI